MKVDIRFAGVSDIKEWGTLVLSSKDPFVQKHFETVRKKLDSLQCPNGHNDVIRIDIYFDSPTKKFKILFPFTACCNQAGELIFKTIS